MLSFIPTSVSATTELSPSLSQTETASNDSQFPPITHKVSFTVRISRADGSNYVRDDLPDIPENRVLFYNLTLGLFGTVAPIHVEEFLKYANVPYDPLDENPLPSYGRSIFTKFDQSNGLLQGGNIPGLEVTSIGGGTAIKYMDRILPSPLWIEKRNSESPPPLSHKIGKGLLTHRALDLTPEFGITTRSNSGLDSSYVVFGRLMLEGEEYEQNREFLKDIENVPTYSMDRPGTPGEKVENPTARATESLASTVFAKQREVFRGAAKSFGDTRLEKIYEGKLLRKVMVTKVDML